MVWVMTGSTVSCDHLEGISDLPLLKLLCKEKLHVSVKSFQHFRRVHKVYFF